MPNNKASPAAATEQTVPKQLSSPQGARPKEAAANTPTYWAEYLEKQFVCNRCREKITENLKMNRVRNILFYFVVA